MSNQQLYIMENELVISILNTEEGMEVRIGKEAYGNLAIVGLLEKIKISLLDEALPSETKKSKSTKTNYDA